MGRSCRRKFTHSHKNSPFAHYDMSFCKGGTSYPGRCSKEHPFAGHNGRTPTVPSLPLLTPAQKERTSSPCAPPHLAGYVESQMQNSHGWTPIENTQGNALFPTKQNVYNSLWWWISSIQQHIPEVSAPSFVGNEAIFLVFPIYVSLTKEKIKKNRFT